MALVNFSGIASGVDSSGLIKALLDQQRQTRIAPLKEKVSDLEGTNVALSKLKELLSAVDTVAQKFRLLNGGAIATQATSSDETVLTATSNNGARSGSYTVTTTQLAKAATLSFDTRYASSGNPVNGSINDGAAAADRTVTFTIGTGSDQETVAVELTSSSTLADLVTSFNSQSTKATASLVNVGTSSAPSYAFVVKSNKTGTAEGEIGVTVGSEIQTAGGGAFTSNTLDQATNAQFSVSGISGTITRSSNVVSDVLDGVSLSLQNTGTARVNIGDDADASAAVLQDFVDAYNELVSYIAENDLVRREEDGSKATNIFGPLASSSLDENILSALRANISGTSNSSGAVRIFADLGITTERDGTLKFDSDKFKEALSNDAVGVRSLLESFGERVGSISGTIAQFSRFNGLLDVSINENNSQISNHQNQIADIEKQLSLQEQSLVARYARLESLIGSLNSQQSALSGIMPS